jgi:2-polyprenyl-3-methyl-5-hydroxy-6-metoxy-1,4-benzoquinol methylase
MATVPNLVERTLLRGGLFPSPILDLMGAATFRAVGAALDLGLFEALAAGPLSSDEIASRLAVSREGLDRLVEVLVATSYLERTGARLRNSKATSRWLLRDSPESLASFVALWCGTAFDLWDGLEESIRTGRPALHMHDWLAARPDGWATFNAAMRGAAKQGADEIARRARLPARAERLLDVGGSHALFSVAFCRRHPRLRATVFDLPEALASAEQTIREQGLEARIDTRAGDMVADPFGAGYDVVLLFNVLHYFDGERNTAILAKAATALNPGGVVVVAEQLADRAPLPLARAMVGILSLQYFATLGARVYAEAEIAGWMRRAGFAAPRRIGLRRTPGQYLLVAARS